MQQFILHFLISTILSSVLILIILIIKRLLHKAIGVRWPYYIDLLCIALLMLPFIPNRFLANINLYNISLGNHNFNAMLLSRIDASQSGTRIILHSNWLQDFSQSVYKASDSYIYLIILTLWAAGIIISAIKIVINNRSISILKRNILQISDAEIESLYKFYKTQMHIKKDIILGESPLIQSPIAFGFVKSYIILPSQSIIKLSTKEIGFIIQHELNHFRNMDILVNYIICAFRILYWFNPCAVFLMKVLRNDREIACDAAVLKTLDESSYIDYGNTIINFAEVISNSYPSSLTAMLGGDRKQIIKRIKRIADFSKETKWLRKKSIAVFTLICILIFSQAPSISAISINNNRFDFHAEQVVYEDLSSYFNHINGCFVLYDQQTGQYTIYNKEKSITRVSPDSTYKIYSALIAMEAGIIKDKKGLQNWNNIIYPYKEWNHSQDLSSAMRNSVSWYFQNLDKAVGLQKLNSYYHEMKYGNQDLSGGISDYWMESSLLISPVEQVELLKDLHNYHLSFQPKNIDTIKDVIKLSEKDGAVLSGKTGTGTVNNRNVNGWFIGYVERNDNIYYFATNISDKNNASGSVAANITLSILEDKNIY